MATAAVIRFFGVFDFLIGACLMRTIACFGIHSPDLFQVLRTASVKVIGFLIVSYIIGATGATCLRWDTLFHDALP